MTERRRSDRRASSHDYLMTDEQAAEAAHVSPHTIRHWRAAGILPFVRVGKCPRIWHSQFLKLFQKPLPHWALETGKMPSAGDIRR